jgi:hypothetical protein
VAGARQHPAAGIAPTAAIIARQEKHCNNETWHFAQ